MNKKIPTEFLFLLFTVLAVSGLPFESSNVQPQQTASFSAAEVTAPLPIVPVSYTVLQETREENEFYFAPVNKAEKMAKREEERSELTRSSPIMKPKKRSVWFLS